MTGTIDLHTHSTASDGTLSPSELVFHAKNRGLCAIALTDHDTTDGLKEAASAAKEAGVELIPGIEISADYEGEMHLLGLFIDPDNPKLQAALADMKQFRATRNLIMIRRLKELGYDITSEEVCALKPGGEPNNIGRIHMARLLVQKGYFPDVRDVFDTCLGTGCPAYYERQRYSPAECLKLIHHAGGISFLAHPYLIAKSYRSLYPIVQSLKQDGLDGIECIYSSHSPAYEDMCRELCRTQSLIVSAGSDFHGANKPHVQLGRVYGNQTIPESILQKIKEFYRNRL
jgi:predicted metal-dependent phosphoesterase TrpH